MDKGKKKMITDGRSAIIDLEKNIVDIHTHHSAPYPKGIIDICLHRDYTSPELKDGQLYSVGIHPWDTVEEVTEEEWQELERLAADPRVVAIGECGIDLTPHGGPLFRQLQVFKRQIELSEKFGKPIIVHNVKGDDIIIGARKDLKPAQPWAIHGFRRKPEVARMLLRSGCYLSFGPEYNVEALRITPKDRILIETDESQTTIEDLMKQVCANYGEDISKDIRRNVGKFLEIEN